MDWMKKGAGILFIGNCLAVIPLQDYYYIEETAALLAMADVTLVAGGYVYLRIKQGVDVSVFKEWAMGLFKKSAVSPRRYNWVDDMERFAPGTRKDYALPIGYNPDTKKALEVPMRGSESHLLFSGITGTGKSVALNQLIIGAGMSGLYQVVIVSLSGKDYQIPAKMKNVHLKTFAKAGKSAMENITQFAQDLPSIIGKFNEEVVSRQSLVEQYKVRDFSDIPDKERPPSILLVIEEFTNALEQVRLENGAKAMNEVLGKVQIAVQFGRSSNMHLCLVGQRPTKNIPNNIQTQMVLATMRVKDSQESYWATGKKGAGAELLDVVDPKRKVEGEALIAGSWNDEKVKIPLTSDAVLQEVAMRYESTVPDLGQPEWCFGKSEPIKLEHAFAVPTTRTHHPYPPPVPTTRTHHKKEGATSGGGVSIKEKVADRVHKPLNVQVVERWAEKVYQNDRTFKEFLDGKKAYTLARTKTIFILLHHGWSHNQTMDAVFGNRGKYRPYVRMCEASLKQLNRLWSKRYG